MNSRLGIQTGSSLPDPSIYILSISEVETDYSIDPWLRNKAPFLVQLTTARILAYRGSDDPDSSVMHVSMAEDGLMQENPRIVCLAMPQRY